MTSKLTKPPQQKKESGCLGIILIIMKKFILPFIVFVFFLLATSSSVYAVPEATPSSQKSTSSYNPYCWSTHMIDQMAVCSKAHSNCVSASGCPRRDLKAHALCLTECNNVLKACYNKASADYKVCIEAEKQAKKQQGIQLESKATLAPSKKPEIQDKSSESTPFNIFAFNPLETWRNIQEILDIKEGFPALLQSSQFLTEFAEVPVEVPRPSIAFDPEGKPWDFLPGYIPHESIYLGNTMRISEGTKISVGGSNQGNDKKLLNLEEGEVEVIKNELNVTDSEYDGIKTQNAIVLSIQTHYWVSYDKKKNQTAVAIYEGKVEVKTKDGQTTTVSPNGDKLGIVVVAQKLSIPKLVLAGLVLIAIIAGAVFLFKKR